MPQGRLSRLCCCCRRCFRRRDGESALFHTPSNSASGSFASAIDDEEDAVWPAVRTALVAELSKASTQALAGASDFANGLQPVGTSQAPAAAWRDSSSPGLADCHVRTVRGGPRTETSVAIAVDTVNQASHFPLVEKGENPHSLRGALVQLLEFQSWPRWMMYSEQATVIRSWGPGQQIVHLSFKLPLGVRLEAIVFAALVDRLDTEGFLEVVVCSPASAIYRATLRDHADSLPPEALREGNGRFLGVQAGGRRSLLGVMAEVDFAAVRIRPHEEGGGNRHRLEFSLSGEEKLPLDSVIDVIWRSLSRNLVPTLGRHITQDRGSCFSPSKMAFYEQVAARISKVTTPTAARPQEAAKDAEQEASEDTSGFSSSVTGPAAASPRPGSLELQTPERSSAARHTR